MNRLQVHTFIGRCLAPIHKPEWLEKLAQDITSGQLDWQKIVRMASEHLVTPAFYPALQRKNLSVNLAPELRDYFSVVYDLNRERNNYLTQQLKDLLRIFNAMGITPILLKGAAVLLGNHYPDPAERVLGDLDILFVSGQIHPVVKRLYRHGYCYAESKDFYNKPPTDAEDDPIEAMRCKELPFLHHIYPLVHPHGRAEIELHFRLVTQLTTTTLLDPQDVEERAGESTVEGLNARFLADEDYIIHNFLHTQIQDHNAAYGRIQLRPILDLAQLMKLRGDRIDWDKVAVQIQRGDFKHRFLAYLQSAQKLCGVHIPNIFQPSITSRLFETRRRALLCCKPLALINTIVVVCCLEVWWQIAPRRIKLLHPGAWLIIAYARELRTLLSKLTQRRRFVYIWRRFMLKIV